MNIGEMIALRGTFQQGGSRVVQEFVDDALCHLLNHVALMVA